MQTKQADPVLSIKAMDDATGEFEGYGSTFLGDPDSVGDIVMPGAYKDSLADHAARGTMPKMFWQHDPHQPIGKWLEAKEDDRGLLMRGRLNMGVQRGKEAYNDLLARTFIDLPILEQPRIIRKDYTGKEIRVTIGSLNQQVRRIFSRGSWEMNGRFYGPWWQGLNSSLRSQIFINDTPDRRDRLQSHAYPDPGCSEGGGASPRSL